MVIDTKESLSNLNGALLAGTEFHLRNHLQDAWLNFDSIMRIFQLYQAWFRAPVQVFDSVTSHASLQLMEILTITIPSSDDEQKQHIIDEGLLILQHAIKLMNQSIDRVECTRVINGLVVACSNDKAFQPWIRKLKNELEIRLAMEPIVSNRADIATSTIQV